MDNEPVINPTARYLNLLVNYMDFIFHSIITYVISLSQITLFSQG